MSFVERISVAFTEVFNGLAAKTPALLAALIVVALTWLAGKMTFSITRRVLARRSTTAHVDVLVARFATAGVAILGAVVALAVLGVDLTALAASLGLVGVTVGFALKDVLANSVSGVMLLLQRPFGIGDSVSVAGVEGVVEDVRVRDTVVLTADGRRAYVPNTTVFNEVVVNASHSTVRRFEITVSVAADADVTEVAERIREAVASVSGVLAEPPADAAPLSVGLSRAMVVAHGWVDTRVTGLDAARASALSCAAIAARGAGSARR
jgi:small conductance mechanosensitive channel